jgi:hypothetical protein
MSLASNDIDSEDFQVLTPEDDSEDFQVLTPEEVLPASPEVINEEKVTKSEDSDALSEAEIRRLEDRMKTFNETVGQVKSQKWYHPNHSKFIVQQFIEEAFETCSAQKKSPKKCAENIQKKAKRTLNFMNKKCTDEGANTKACTDAINACIMNMEEGTGPLINFIEHLKNTQLRIKTNPVLVKTAISPSWWNRVKNSILGNSGKS